MKLAGFFGLPKKRKYPKGNYSLEVANLINGNFQSSTPHKKWFIDITQKRYLSGTIYLAVIKDAATRVVVGYATGRGPNSDLVARLSPWLLPDMQVLAPSSIRVWDLYLSQSTIEMLPSQQGLFNRWATSDYLLPIK